MLKKLLFMLIVSFLYIKADMVNGIAATVNNEPITTYDVLKLKKQMSISDAEALNLLIKERLEQSQIKQLDLQVSPFEVNERIAALAKQNGLTPAKFRDAVVSRGIKFSNFSADVKQNLLKEKLYQHIVANAAKTVNESKAKTYYEAHKDKFAIFDKAQVNILSSYDPRMLEAKTAEPMRSIAGVNISSKTIQTQDIADPKVLSILASTPVGTYTPIVRNQSGVFETYYIINKSGNITLDFDRVKDLILNQMYANEQDKLVNDYFQKLRAKAKINIIR